MYPKNTVGLLHIQSLIVNSTLQSNPTSYIITNSKDSRRLAQPFYYMLLSSSLAADFHLCLFFCNTPSVLISYFSFH